MKIYKFFGGNEDRNILIEFVEKNKYKCKIIYKNKKIPLKRLFKIPENIVDTSKLKLIFYNHIFDINKISDIFLLPGMIFPEYRKFEKIKIKKIWICIDLLNIIFVLLLEYLN